MAFDLDAPGAADLLAAHLTFLHHHAAELARAAAGTWPSAADLASAPTMLHPLRVQRPEPALRGYVPDNERMMTTGRLLIWAPGKGWARTTDGLWRLEGEGR
jgi:hypothetical protein